jgi:heat shock protein HtpX
MAIAKRIFFFLLTNILVIATISIFLNVILPIFGIHLNPASMMGLLIFCAVWGFGGAFVSLLMSKWMAKNMMGVRIISDRSIDPNDREILDMVHSISRRAGLKTMPEVGIYDSPEVNAFATGPSKNNSLVALSTGLLRKMNRNEVEGVIGHEVAHVANGDMVTMTLIQGVINAFVMFFARVIANIISSNVNENMRSAVYFGVTILLDIVFSILGSIVVAYFSRMREYRADRGGAQFTSRDKMIAALKRLQSNFEQVAPDNSAMSVMKISNRPGGLMALFSTHPPLSERIRRLEMGM